MSEPRNLRNPETLRIFPRVWEIRLKKTQNNLKIPENLGIPKNLKIQEFQRIWEIRNTENFKEYFKNSKKSENSKNSKKIQRILRIWEFLKVPRVPYFQTAFWKPKTYENDKHSKSSKPPKPRNLWYDTISLTKHRLILCLNEFWAWIKTYIKIYSYV